MHRELACMSRRLESFRRRSGSSRPRYAVDLREEVVAVAQRAMEAGWSRRSVLSALGLSAPTLARWMSGGVGLFRAVRLVEDDEALPAERATRSVRVITPSGWTIEGLDLAEVVELLERAG